MAALPPHVKAYADELLAIAPPFTPAQERFIQQQWAPLVRDLAEVPAA